MKSLWNYREARELVGLPEMVYASRQVGAEPSLVLWGGGNTSIKVEEKDFRGRATKVLRVKGSGTDLKSISEKGFSGVKLDDILPLIETERMTDEEMTTYLAHCMMDPTSPRPSIETLLHGFIPFEAVIHTHADAILFLTNTSKGESLVKQVLGPDIIWIPYIRPGFAMSKQVGQAVRANPTAPCVVLEKHGLITWGHTAKEAYEATIRLMTLVEEFVAAQGQSKPQPFGEPLCQSVPALERDEAWVALLPLLRGWVSRQRPMVLRVDHSADFMELVNSERAKELCTKGPATPDHLLTTKRMPLYLELPLGNGRQDWKLVVQKAMEDYVTRYTDYVKLCHGGKLPTPCDPYPRIILVPGLGVVTTGKDVQASLMANELYHQTVAVMKGAQIVDEFQSISEKDICEVEYWPLELYKLTLAAPEKEFSRRVVLVTGAAGGIGKVVARRFAEEGAHVVVTDVDEAGAQRAAAEIAQAVKMPRVVGIVMDVTSEASVAQGFRETVKMFGGLDIVFSNAGVAHSSSVELMELKDWEWNFKVNSTGHFLVAREAVRIMRAQEMGGSLVFNASKNVLAPGKDFSAYSASKAAESQLARVLAIENGAFGIRVNLVNPDAVFTDSKLWSSEVRAERAKAQGIKPEELEKFYQSRNLLKTNVEPEDVADAVLFLASKRSAKTTGAVLPVDGGLREAFPR